MRTVMVVVLGMGLASAAPIPKDLKKPEDKALIVGKWEVARANVNGQEVAKYDPEHTVTFTAEGTATFQYPNGPDQPNDFQIDTAASPRTVTFLRKSVVIGKPRPYEFRDGRLIMAISVGERNPIQTLEPGPGVIILEYKRAEKK